MEGSGLTIIETQSEARYYPSSSGPALVYYRRETTDGRYWGQLENGRVWTGPRRRSERGRRLRKRPAGQEIYRPLPRRDGSRDDHGGAA